MDTTLNKLFKTPPSRRKSKCRKGTRRNKKTGRCERHTKSTLTPFGVHNSNATMFHSRYSGTRCPTGTRRIPGTDKCSNKPRRKMSKGSLNFLKYLQGKNKAPLNLTPS